MSGFRKAKAEQAALKIGIYGPSGSGKTFTSLLLAEGLAKILGKRIAVADSERGTDFYCQAVSTRKVHPDAFDFDALYTRSLTEVSREIRNLDTASYGVVIIDSITHYWEAARLAYQGRTTSIGTIPFHAWGQIKKPYKELMAFLLSSPMHVFILGRQGNEYATDEETDELRMVGVKMKSEGETPYEPHILIRMEAMRQKKGDAVVTAYIEKDRTGVLAGKLIQWPNFDNICAPLLPLLGGMQGKISSEDEIAAHDGEQLADQERQRTEISENLLRTWTAKIDLSTTMEELKAIGKQLTPAEKAKLLPNHVTQLRERYQTIERTLGGQPPLKTPAKEEQP